MSADGLEPPVCIGQPGRYLELRRIQGNRRNSITNAQAHTRTLSLSLTHKRTRVPRILHFLQDQEFGGGGHGPDEEGGTMRYGGNGAYGEWAVDENATNFNETEAWNGRNGNTFRRRKTDVYTHIT